VPVPEGRAGDQASPPVRLRVRCGGRLHEVLYWSGGPLDFPRHSRADLGRDLRRLQKGKDACRCACVLEAWRFCAAQGHGGSPLPAALNAAARAGGDVHFARPRSGRPFRDQLATWAWHERPGFLARLIGRLLLEGRGLPARVACGVRDVRGVRPVRSDLREWRVIRAKQVDSVAVAHRRPAMWEHPPHPVPVLVPSPGCTTARQGKPGGTHPGLPPGRGSRAYGP
jgi:hypothetical protein